MPTRTRSLILPLQNNVVYVNDDSREVTIGGTTKHYPELVWSYSGDWYERATGHYVFSTELGEHYTLPANWRNLSSNL